VPFRDVNDVRAIVRDGDRIRFEARNGALVYSPDHDAWEVEVAEVLEPEDRDGERETRERAIPLGDPRGAPLVSDWYARGQGDIVATDETGDRRWALVRRYAEGGNPSADEVVEPLAALVYRLRPQASRALLVTEQEVWVGHLGGVTHIDRASGRRSEYRALPSFRTVSGWVEHDDVRYVTTSEGSLLAVTAAHEITEIPLPEAALDLHDAAWGFGADRPFADVRWRLTNPLVRDGRIYVGAFATDPLVTVVESQSFLLIYDPKMQDWSVRLLPPGIPVRHLVEDRGTIWMLGNWRFADEGGDVHEQGGLARLRANGRIEPIRDCAGVPVRSWRTDEEGITFLLAAQPFEETTYFECAVALGAHAWSPGKSPANEREAGDYPLRDFELPAEALPELATWRVRPRVVRIERPLRILRDIDDYELP
jgi:hypothetical protein